MKIITNPAMLRKNPRWVTRQTNLKKLNDSIRRTARALLNTGYGVGLSATQVGIDKRFCVVIIQETFDKSTVKVFVNPVVIAHSEQTTNDVEGCLSYPNQYGTVTRYNEITVKHLDTHEWIQKEEKFYGMNARVLQHEIDHLDGICCMDKARDIFIKELPIVEAGETQ